MSIPTLYVSKKSTADPLLDLLSRKKTKGTGTATPKLDTVDEATKGKKGAMRNGDEKTTVLDEMPMLNFLSSDVKQDEGGGGSGTPGFGRQRGKPLWSSDRLGGGEESVGRGPGSGSGERLFGMKVRGKRGLLKGKRSQEKEEGAAAVETKIDGMEKKKEEEEKEKTKLDSVRKKIDKFKKKQKAKEEEDEKIHEGKVQNKHAKDEGRPRDVHASKRGATEKKTAKDSTHEEDALNLASLAAQAGASAATGKVPGVKETQGDDVTGEKTLEKEVVEKSTRKPIMTKEAGARRQKRAYRKRSDMPPLEVNGISIPRVVGVPDDVLTELASMPPTERPVRCGFCRSCENPARKKACEVMRSLGANPPIPRGKNRLAILGPDNVKKHVSRTCNVPFSNTPLGQGDDAKKKFTPASADKNTGDLAEKMEGATDDWTEEQLQALHQALLDISPNTNDFWLKVSYHVPGRNRAECFAKIYENAPLYSSSNKPKARNASTPLDPNDEGYLSNLMKRRRDRAMGTLGKRMRIDSKILKATTADGVSGKQLLQDILQALKAADKQDDGGKQDSDWSDAE
ncbi:hypothetical protein PSENEW3_00000436 [Picochlorum sp. SENEW3]|nr:hypothetical protein PSENEW3_00000436 [Picochlorum sp. SENEW3]